MSKTASTRRTVAESIVPIERVQQAILMLRGQRILLDSDLARIYQVETKVLVRAVKRNIERFPEDFMFQLSTEELQALRCQNGTSKGRGGRRYRPYAFTEHGAREFKNPDAVMAASMVDTVTGAKNHERR